jgi:hypothetical protein
MSLIYNDILLTQKFHTSCKYIGTFFEHLAFKFVCQLLLFCLNLFNAAHFATPCVVGRGLKMYNLCK